VTFSIRNWLRRGRPGASATRGNRRLAQRLVDRGIAAEKTGSATTALDHFRDAVAADGSFAPAHMNLGIAEQAAGDLSAAITCYERAIAVLPSYAAAHYNLGLAHLLSSRYPEAETQFRTALGLQNDFPEAWVGLAGAYEALGRDEDALAALDKAIASRSDYVGALLNTLALLRKLGRFERAIATSRRVLELEPDNYVAHGTLGIGLQALGQLSDAEASYRRALTFNSDYVEAKAHLAVLLQTTGRIQEAIPWLFDLVANEPADTPFRGNLTKALSAGFSISKTGEKGRQTLLSLCKDDDAFVTLSPSIIALMKCDRGFQALQKIAQRGDDPFASPTAEVAAFFRDPLLLASLPRMSFWDAKIEEVLTHVRRCILLRFKPGSGMEFNDPDVPTEFTCALARQCFFSGYAFFVDEDELEQVENLREALQESLGELFARPRALESSLAVVALYDSLHTLKGCERLLEPPMESWSAAFRPLMQEQIADREREIEIAKQLTSITTIDDKISKAVREQYEENPYPRWVVTRRPRTDTIEKLSRRLRPNQEVRVRPRPVPILVAGCGTGKHPISVAITYPDSDILAIDLSLRSLSYAARMTERLGVSNVTYRQADILQLGSLDRRFAIIECVGVLHHLDDPMSGWRTLAGLLESDGLMRIGLYSEKARAAVRTAREFVRSLNVQPTADGIRRCRRAILRLPDGHPAKDIVNWGTDFFLLDGCRDLVMHVQEHQFTLPRIGECLDQLGMEFLGLESSTTTLRRFEEMFSDKQANTNLDAWHQFEEVYPETFLSMYLFWSCRKRTESSSQIAGTIPLSAE
jgi:tetratricopeptide (TPR) repeat protein/2-polyprenyl-3-methyl-5-hydroxy-6-metoxy-1,4-benzoquinol methylase